METLDLPGHKKSHFAQRAHNHAQQIKQLTSGTQSNLNHNVRGETEAEAAATNLEHQPDGHNSRDRLADASSCTVPMEQDNLIGSSRSQEFTSSSIMLTPDCMLLNKSNKMQYSAAVEAGANLSQTNQSADDEDCFMSADNCSEPLTDEDAFIAFCADSSSVLNNDLNRRYHVNKLYQPLLDSSSGEPNLGQQQDDEFLLYQELKSLCEPSERTELSKMLDDDNVGDQHDTMGAVSNRLADCADLMGQDSLELTSIIDSIEAFESSAVSPTTLIDSSNQFHCSSSSSPDKPDSSGRGNERSPVSNYASLVAASGDCYPTSASFQMELSQHETSSFFYHQTPFSAADNEPLLLAHTPSSRPSTCEQSVYQDAQSDTGSVALQTGNSTPQPEAKIKDSAGGARASRRSAHVNHYRRRTANARERIRMREINQAFEKLKKVVPIELVREASEAEAASERAAQEQAAGSKKSQATKTVASNSQSSDSSPKLTKITTLRMAVSYISKLSSLLNDNPEGCSDVGNATPDSSKKNGAKVASGRLTKEANKKRRSRASAPAKKQITTTTTSASDNENKANNKKMGKSKASSVATTHIKVEVDEVQKNNVTPNSIAAFNDANGFKRIDLDDEKQFKIENGADLKAQQPILFAESPLFNRTIGNQQPQTAYIAIPHHQNQKQQYLTTYQPGQQQQQHSMISQTHFNQNHDRLLVAPVPVAILVSNLVYINPMRQGVRQQQFCLVNQPQQQQQQQHQQQGLGSQQSQNGSSQTQILTTKQQVELVKSVTTNSNQLANNSNQTNINETSQRASGDQIVPTSQTSFIQTKFVPNQFPRESQLCQQQQQQQPAPQIRPDELLESNINKLVASLVTSPTSNTGDNHQQNKNHQQTASGNQQQPVRTYRFHNYDGNIRL